VLLGTFAVKALRKCFSSRVCREVNPQNDLPSILIAVKPRRFIPMALEPAAHHDHLTSKILSLYSYGHTPHAPSLNVLALATGVLVRVGCQIKEL
jgi:hypothetical protein